MTKYPFIESRDPFGSTGASFYRLAAPLARREHPVAVFLIQNGVLTDPPYEDARTTSALRLIDRAVKRGFDVRGLQFGERRQTQPPDLVRDPLGALAGRERHELAEVARPIASRAVPELLEGYEQVWRW